MDEEPGKTGLFFRRHGMRFILTKKQEERIRKTYRENEGITKTAKQLGYSGTLVTKVIEFYEERIKPKQEIGQRLKEARIKKDPNLSDLGLSYFDGDVYQRVYLTKIVEQRIIKTYSEKGDIGETCQTLNIPPDLISKVLEHHELL